MIEGLLALVGFIKLRWQFPNLLLLAEMALDFGGIGNEYAVDRAHDLAVSRQSNPFLIKFSGDLRTNRPPPHPKATPLDGFGAIAIATAQVTMNQRQARTFRWELSIEPAAGGGSKLTVTITLH